MSKRTRSESGEENSLDRSTGSIPKKKYVSSEKNCSDENSADVEGPPNLGPQKSSSSSADSLNLDSNGGKVFKHIIQCLFPQHFR